LGIVSVGSSVEPIALQTVIPRTLSVTHNLKKCYGHANQHLLGQTKLQTETFLYMSLRHGKENKRALI